MNFVRLTLDQSYGNYSCYQYSNSEMNILGNFFSDDIGCYSPTFREWATKEHWKGASGNITMVEKEGGFIYLTDLYSEEKSPTEVKMTVEQFVQILDDWRDKVCATKPKEVVIKYENDKFIIETHTDVSSKKIKKYWSGNVRFFSDFFWCFLLALLF